MKIIILTAKFGMGHFSAAKAIEKKLRSKCCSDTVKLIDMVEDLHGDYADPIYNLYRLFIGHGSKLYNLAYKKAVDTESNAALKLAHRHLLASVERMMEREKPDIVISTYSVSSELVSLCKNKTTANYQLITVITDIKPHGTWVNEGTNAYLVADEKTQQYLLEMGVGVPIHITGIPVSEEFERISVGSQSGGGCRGKGREGTFHGLSPRRLLIMGGGLGMLPRGRAFYKALNRIKNLKTTVITGKNKKLYKKLNNRYENIEVVGYSKNIPDLMKQADLLLTKAGGITTFEAIYAQLPMLVFKPFLEQESSNARFIQEKRIGWVSDFGLEEAREIVPSLQAILFSDNTIRSAEERMGKLVKQLNIHCIHDIIEKERKQFLVPKSA